MRIVAGRLRGRLIVAPKGHSTRPTTDRTRQALFNVLEHAAWSPPLQGARILDLFAGSGALGLEALSRGGAWCLFVERDAAARQAIAANLQSLGLTEAARILTVDATRLGQAEAPFDITFLDPPYRSGFAEQALPILLRGGWLSAGAVVVAESGAGEALTLPVGLDLVDDRRWGLAQVRFARHSSAPAR